MHCLIGDLLERADDWSPYICELTERGGSSERVLELGNVCVWRAARWCRCSYIYRPRLHIVRIGG